MTYEALKKIDTRREMFKELDDAINNINEEPDDEELEPDDIDFSELEGEEAKKPSRGTLKALIIESNSPFEKIRLPESMRRVDTGEPEIKLLLSTENNSYSYLDMMDERYWVLYSLDKSDEIRRDVKNLIQDNNSHLDYAWFSSNSLRKMGCDYPKSNFSMRYRNFFRFTNMPVENMSIRLWAADTSKMMDVLFANKEMNGGACLSNMEVRYSSMPNFYVKTRLSMNGCFNVTKGNSIDEFVEYKNRIVEGHYKPLIEHIEEQYTSKYTVSADGINIKGDILSIKLDHKISDLEKFCSMLLKGTNPYRMTGYGNKIADDHYLLNVLDLHTYDLFDLEVFDNELFINLPEGCCGNCVTRLFTLFQHTVTPQSRIMGGESNAIL